jgi:predicted TIM-barrel fold metal-dependent hydrolase
MPLSRPLLLDAHTHVFPPRSAAKSVAWTEAFFGIKAACSGQVEDLLKELDAAGLDRAVALCIAMTPEQVAPANSWAIRLQQTQPRLVACGALHPGLPTWERELDRLRAAGVRGVKLHPEIQGVPVDDPALFPLLEALRPDFTLVIHCGGSDAASPRRLANLLRQAPHPRVVAAHLGGRGMWREALESLIGSEVYLDTSSSLDLIDEPTLQAIFSRHPRERILFGSDYPITRPLAARNTLQTRLGLSDKETEELLTNGARLFLTQTE